MTSPFREAAATLVIGLCMTGPALAQDEASRAAGRPIAAIHFEVEGRPVVSPDLNELVGMKAGDPLRLEAVRDAESRLINAKGYDEVEVRVTETAAGLDLLFALTPRHPIDRVEIVGEQTGLPPAELDRRLREQYGGLPSRERPQSVALLVQRLLADEGYAGARVEPRVNLTHDPDRATLVLTVAAGVQATIASTRIDGTSPLSTDRIVALTGTAPGSPFRRSELETRLAAIEDDLRRQGYFSAVAVLPGEPVASEDGRGLVVTLLVNAGPQVTLRWDGLKPAGDDEDFIPMRRQRSIDEDLLEDSDIRVAGYWRRQGYHDVVVTHTREVLQDRLVVTMHVNRGVRHVIDSIRLTGNAHMAEASVLQTLDVHPGEPYDTGRLASGIARLRAGYLTLGYHRVAIQELEPEDIEGSRDPTQVRVVVHVDVAEGPQARIASVSLDGVRADLQGQMGRLLSSRAGSPYVQSVLLQDISALQETYRNLGFENVEVKAPPPEASADGTSLAIVIQVTEGPQIFVGDIRVIGNRRVSEAAVRDEMTLKEGTPLGDETRRESQRRLYRLGVFRQVSIDEEPRASGDTVAHIVVTVEELPANSIGVGVGLEGGRQPLRTPEGTFSDRAFLSPRGSFEIGRRNLWGKNRSIDFFSRAAPRPATSTTERFGFLEYRVAATYREPRAFNSDSELILGVASEQAVRTGFNFSRRSGSLQVLRRVSSRLSVTGRYGLEYTKLLDQDRSIEQNEQIVIDRLFSQVRLVLLSSSVVWDRRDDLANPGRGTLTSADVDFSARAFGSQTGFAKIFVQTSGYRALDAARRVVFAARAELGVSRGFKQVKEDPETLEPVTVDGEVPISQRFFAGGSTTVRGFQLDRLGVASTADRPGVLTADGLSLGGNGVVILNAELRTSIGRLLGREFGLTGFADAGNVFAKAGDINVSRLRTAVGFGVRYYSPLGVVRLDLGFKTDRQTFTGGRERGWEYHLNIGEAF